MIRKLFGLLTLTLAFCLTILGTAEAKPQVELLNIFAYNMDRTTVKVQIDYRGKLNPADVSLESSGSLMTLSINGASPGRINRIIERNIQAKNIIESVTVNSDKENTRLDFSMVIDFEQDGYTAKVTTREHPNPERKYSQMIIEIVKTGEGVQGSGSYQPQQPRRSGGENIDGTLSGRVVVLDAGHGGSDRGAVGPSGLTEKEVTLSVALKTEERLLNSGAEVIMTRRTDKDVASPNASNTAELGARVATAPRDAEIFISIHCNAFSNPNSNGMETFYYSGSSASYRLAALLNEELQYYGGLSNRGIKSANFYVIKHTHCPSSLIELGFITNYEEERLLASDEYQEKLAQAIVAAINRFFNE